MAYVSVVPRLPQRLRVAPRSVPVQRPRPGGPLPVPGFWRPPSANLQGLGKFKLKKIFKPIAKVVKKVAAVAVAPIVAVATAPFAPKLAPKLLKSAGVIGEKRAAQLTKVIKSAVVPAAIIAGGAFLLPVLGATTLPALSGPGGFLSKAAGGIFGMLKSVPQFLGMTSGQQQLAEEAIAAGQPPPANLPADFLDAYMRAVTTQAAQRPELLPRPPGEEEGAAPSPVTEAGIMGLGGTGTMVALGVAGLVVTMAMGRGNGRGRKRG